MKKDKKPISISVKPPKQYPKHFYLLTLLIPLIILIILEISLRVFGYGRIIPPQWVQASAETPNLLVLNPLIAERYFVSGSRIIPNSINDAFDAVKQAGAFRVFVLGESSAAGFPYEPNGSFSRFLCDKLKLTYPNKKIEVINTAMAAISSYALKDLLPGIIKQKPDLILIYAGHNEYYGALGVGSMEQIAGSPKIVKFVQWLNKFKTVELIRNFFSFATKNDIDPSKTDAGLMKQLAKDQQIEFNSVLYKSGINQFKENLEEMLSELKNASIPVIIGRLTSNIKDQTPFVSLPGANNADECYKFAEVAFAKGDFSQAKQLYTKAKDLDALRFRAPSEINDVISSSAAKFNIPVAAVDSVFESVSRGGIVGDNLMTDHLHPTLAGYNLISRAFFDVMKKYNYIPVSSETLTTSTLVSDSLLFSQFKYTKLDSLISLYRIITIKQNWPFNKSGETKSIDKVVKIGSEIEKIAFKVTGENFGWDKAHLEAAEYYLSKNDSINYLKEMETLCSQYRYKGSFYEEAAFGLMKLGMNAEAYKFLLSAFNIKPSAFNTKWLGILDLSKNNSEGAIKYLNECLNFSNKDPQVYYNLGGAYISVRNFGAARTSLKACIDIDVKFPGAQDLLEQIYDLNN